MAKVKKSLWAVIVAALVAIAAIAAVIVFGGGDAAAKQFATLEVLEGGVHVSKSGGTFAPGRDGQSLTEGDVVRTDADGLAEIVYFDDSLTRLGPDTEFELTELASLDNEAQSKRIKGTHARGRTWNRVTELADTQSRFEIETPVATAAVKGTVFATFCDFFGDCTVAAIEDVTEVLASDGTVITLQPLQAVTIDADGTIGEVVQFDSLADMIAALDWVEENACNIEALAECEPDDGEIPDPDPTESATPEPSPTVTTDTGTTATGDEPTTGGEPTSSPPSTNFAPEAAFVPAGASGAAPLGVSFTNQSSDPDGDPLTFVWTFGDGATSTAVNPSYVFTAGVWSVTLTARDGSGATDSVSHLVEANDVTAPSSPTFSSPAPGALITSSPVEFTGDAEEGSLVQVFDGGEPIGSDVANSPFSVTAELSDGVHSITATATDVSGNESAPTAALLIEVDAVNDDPTAAADELSTTEDTAGSVNVLANDSDPNGDALSVTSVSGASNGSVTDLGGGVVSYSPDANFDGNDSFTYTVSDGRGGTDTATVTVTVAPVNDAPNAIADADSTPEDDAITIDVLANDTDADGDPLSVTSFGQGSNGTVSSASEGDGLLVYTPDPNFTGTDTFTYTVSDGNGGSDTATVSVTVTDVNDPPDAVNNAVSTNEDTPVTVTPLTNDSDPDGDSLSVTSFSQPSNGIVEEAGAPGSLVYTPDPDFNGTDSFTYTVSDGNGGSDTATITVTVTNVNDGPDAVNDSENTTEDSAITVDVLANDSDPDGDSLSVTSFTQGSNGTVAAEDGGDGLVYTPAGDFHGTDSFTYTISDGNGGSDTATVTVTVTTVNDPPDAVNDPATTSEDTSAVVDVLANDTDADGDSLSVTSFTQGSNGTVSDEEEGDGLVYTPAGDFSGTDSFTYTISDGNGGTDTATVTVTVTNVNDGPDAVDDQATTNEDTAVQIDVLDNDTDPENDALTISSFTQGTHGDVSMPTEGSGLVYTPDAGFSGTDTFTYTISDGNGGSDTATVNVTVTPVNDGPDAVDDSDTTTEDNPIVIDVLDNDTDPEGDGLSITSFTQPANGTVTPPGEGSGLFYTPDPGFSGSDSFTYTISDGNGGTDTATVTVTVTSVNDGPTAALSGSPTSGEADLLVTFSTAGSTDPDDGIASWSIDFGDDGSDSGTGAPPASIQHTYTSAGTYTATLTVTDGGGLFDTDDSESISVTQTNQAPDAVNDTASQTGEPVTVNVLANDTDPDDDPLAVSIVSQPGSGTAVVNTNQTITYTPNAGFGGTDGFTYRATDPGGLFDDAQVTISGTVGAVTIVLQWSSGPRDLDLHVQTPIGEVAYFSPCIGTDCWASLDQDQTQVPNQPGVETVTIRPDPGLGTFRAGSYVIFVDNFSCTNVSQGPSPFAASNAQVTVNTGSSSQTFSVPTGGTQKRWNVGTLNLASDGTGSTSATQTFSGSDCGSGGSSIESLSVADEGERERDGRRRDRRGSLREARSENDRTGGARRWGGAEPDSDGSAVALDGVRARVEGDKLLLDWRPQDVGGTVRYSGTDFPTRSTDGRRGCEGVGRCEITGLEPGARIYLTVFVPAEDETTPARGVNALVLTLPADATSGDGVEPAPTEPTAPSSGSDAEATRERERDATTRERESDRTRERDGTRFRR